MASDTKISNLTALAEAPAVGDLLAIVDVSATSTKKITITNLFTSPTFVTPALGTPASGVLTNCTGLPEAGLTLADNTTNDVSATKHGFVPKHPNDTTKFLRGDATWAVPSVTTQTLSFSTLFETAGRFTAAVVADGTNTFGTNGLVSLTSATSGSSASVTLAIGSNATTTNLFNAGAKWSGMFRLDTKGTTGSWYGGIGSVTVAGTGHTFTDSHIGFKVIISGSTATLYATNSGGTETATSLGTITTNDTVWLNLEVVSTSSVNYYWRKTSGAWSSATNHTTNIPTGNMNLLQVSIANDSTASSTRIDMAAMAYSQ